MSLFLLSLTIDSVNDNNCIGTIFYHQHQIKFEYLFQDRHFNFMHGSEYMEKLLQENIFQLRGIFISKRKNTFFQGAELNFSIDSNFKESNLYNDIYVINRKNNCDENYFIQTPTNNIIEVYCDACFYIKTQKAGFCILIKENNGNKIISEAILAESSTQAELIAAIKALEYTGYIENLRLISDSRYVRKGISKWLNHWKLNNWKTANAESPKNIELWKYFESITEKRYIEFQWIKGHYNCEENILCDKIAKQTAIKS